jgi:thioredoxin-related protein
VNRLTREWKDGRVLRVNLIYKVSQEYSGKNGVESTPTFILFDSNGREVQRWVGEAPTPADLISS